MRVFRSIPFLLALVGLAGFVPTPAGADVVPQGMLVGSLTDAETGTPVAAAQLRLRELGRTELSHGDGSFHFERVPAGTYTLVVERIGYARLEAPVEIVDGQTVRMDLVLTPSAIRLGGVVVTGVGRERGIDETFQPTTVLSDGELRRRLGGSVAATLRHEPGIAERFNGPVAAQPVLRGLSGDRLLMLEDGQRTGDIATTASDHAITIDPLGARRIEVVRGPAGLLYGSNALGGVINVVREEVPRSVPDRITGTVSSQVESVNRGVAGGAFAVVPVGSFALRAEASGRTLGESRTPLGPLPSTSATSYTASVGGSWVFPGGYVGVSARDHGLEYGVPGEFEGEQIPGAHEGGVDIDLRRTTARLEAGLLQGAGPFTSFELDAGYVRFEQTEFESPTVVGSQFGQLSSSANLLARHGHEGTSLAVEGAVGASVFWKDFSSSGSFTGSRPATEVVVAGFGYEEFRRGRVRLQVGARYDWTRTTPLERSSTVLGELDRRSFGAFSGSAAALFELREGWTVGASLARAFRTPSIEELFSDGPHLADFSYNIGNPSLPAEFGLGADLFVRVARDDLSLEASIFRNAIDNYINYAPTGELDPRFRRFPVYQARSNDALMEGAEGRFQWEARRRWVVDGSASWVRGTRRDTGDPLPTIPPFAARLGVLHDAPGYFVGGDVQTVASQNRTAPLEDATPGHTLLNIEAGLRWMGWDRLHTLTLGADNVTNRVWRDHLSRTRAVAPQPGRNLRLLYRVTF
jgi:iron complex outermembrane recepter protein